MFAAKGKAEGRCLQDSFPPYLGLRLLAVGFASQLASRILPLASNIYNSGPYLHIHLSKESGYSAALRWVQ